MGSSEMVGPDALSAIPSHSPKPGLSILREGGHGEHRSNNSSLKSGLLGPMSVTMVGAMNAPCSSPAGLSLQGEDAHRGLGRAQGTKNLRPVILVDQAPHSNAFGHPVRSSNPHGGDAVDEVLRDVLVDDES